MLDSLPRWTEEIPKGSFVVVGYTVTVYKAERTGNTSVTWLTPSLRWVNIHEPPPLMMGDPAGSSTSGLFWLMIYG